MLLFTGALWNWHPHVVRHTPGLQSVAIAGRYRWFESTSLQRRVCELSVPERELAPRSSPSGTAVRTGRRLRGPRSSRDMSERCPTIFRTALCGPEKLSSGGGRRGRERRARPPAPTTGSGLVPRLGDQMLLICGCGGNGSEALPALRSAICPPSYSRRSNPITWSSFAMIPLSSNRAMIGGVPRRSRMASRI